MDFNIKLYVKEVFQQKHLADKILNYLDSTSDIKNFAKCYPLFGKVTKQSNIKKYCIAKPLERNMICKKAGERYKNRKMSKKPSEFKNIIRQIAREDRKSTFRRKKYTADTKNLRKKALNEYEKFFPTIKTPFRISVEKHFYDYISYIEEIESFKKLSEISIENVTTIEKCIIVEDDNPTKKDISYLAVSLGKYFDSLFEIFTSANCLDISFDERGDNKELSLLTIKNLTSQKIREIKTLDLINILDCLKNNNFEDYTFFSHLKNLKTVHFATFNALDDQEILKDNINNLTPIIQDIKRIENCKIIFAIRNNLLNFIDKKSFLNFIEKWEIDLNLLDGLADTPHYPINFDDIIGFPLYKLKEAAFDYYMFDENSNFFKSIKLMKNMETLKLFINLEYVEILMQDMQSLEQIQRDAKQMLSLRIPNKLSKLKVLHLNTNSYFPTLEIEKHSLNIFKYVSDYFFGTITENLVELKLYCMNTFDQEMAITIAKKAPNLEYLHIGVVDLVYSECLTYFHKLKYFSYNCKSIIQIPKNIQLVVYFPIYLSKYILLEDFKKKHMINFKDHLIYLEKNFQSNLMYLNNRKRYYYVFFNEINTFITKKQFFNSNIDGFCEIFREE